MRRALIAAATALVFSGCLSGAIFERTTRPLTTDFHDTPAATRLVARGNLKQIRYQWLDVRWDDNAIGSIARKHGMERVFYADIETLRILYWTQTWVLVYGE